MEDNNHINGAVVFLENVGKAYRLFDKPVDRLKHSLFSSVNKTYGRDFWALRNVSLEVGRGESLGIIGKNGAGKSTLLQIIAGTLQPTEGNVVVHGRVAALLELGSGFNPEFTGVENVMMNAAILGMGREEIEKRLDKIISFADIGDFVHQPIKVYSSGMIVRLAFAVQAFVDPEILIVDEALAVGDTLFQHKCMQRIKDLVDNGTTLLFVTHSTETVKRFCRMGLWLDEGKPKYYGEAGIVVGKYIEYIRGKEAEELELANNQSDLAGNSLPTIQSESIDEINILNTLVYQAGNIDVNKSHRLFIRGEWSQIYLEIEKLYAKFTTDNNFLSGFKFNGNRLELSFLAHPKGSEIYVWIDHVPQTVNLFDINGSNTYTHTWALTQGEHHIFISPSPNYKGQTNLYWLGGCVGEEHRLVYKDDDRLEKNLGLIGRFGNGKAHITSVELLDFQTLEPVSEARVGQWVRLRICAKRLEPFGPRSEFSFIVRDKNRLDLFGTTSMDQVLRFDPTADQFMVEFVFEIRLAPGSYSILTTFSEYTEDKAQRSAMDQIDIAYVFDVSFDPQHPLWYLYDEPVVVYGECAFNH